MNNLLGVVFKNTEDDAEDKVDPLQAVVQPLLEDRAKAREEENWARADEIRDQLTEMGVEIMDTPNGARWKRMGNF